MSTPEKSIITNAAGVTIAWVFSHGDTPGGCQARACRKALLAGKSVHIIPAHTDPRAKNWTLAMPTYHFRTVEEAETALNDAWDSAVLAETEDERDGAYAQGYPVAVRHGVGRPAGYVYR